MSENTTIRRRSVIAATGSGLLASLAGCQSLLKNEHPTASIIEADGYKPTKEYLVAYLTFSKPKDPEIVVDLKWQLESDWLTQSYEKKQVLEGETDRITVAMSFPTKWDASEVLKSRIKIIRREDGAEDSDWNPVPIHSNGE